MNLDTIFYPKSVAIIGASTKVGSVGNDIVKNLATQGYTGKIFPVNPKAVELYGMKCYSNIKNIKEKVDLAIIVVPAAAVPEVMQEVAEEKVKGVIIISAGFKEVGNIDGENKIKEICLKHKIALIGPNCLGIINPEIKLNASFAMTMPDKGNVAFISQSGALCTAVLDYAQKLGIGFSKFMSVGNKTLIDEVEIFEYLYRDPETKVIAMYAEQLSKPHKIIASVKKLSHGKNAKPVLVIKSGRTSAGASASASHTGALAGNDAAYDALFAQSGIIRVYSVSELFEYVRVFSDNPLPKGRHTAIITNAGGPGVLTTDEVIASGLELAKISLKTQARLKKYLPAYANFHNPIDVLGDARADRYQATLEILAKDKGVNSIIVILTPQSTTEIEATAEAIIKLKNQCQKPIIASFMGGRMVSKAMHAMQKAGVATTGFPEQAAKALGSLTNFSLGTKEKKEQEFKFKNINKRLVEKIFAEAKQKGKKVFPEAEAMEILAAYNFCLLENATATNALEAQEIANKINKKMVMKIISPDILHKSDVGGVTLNITKENVKEKYEEMIKTIKKKRPTAKIHGVLLVEMAEKGGIEMILGANRDQSLGPMLMVGLGGIFVEIFKDVSFGLAPITKNYAEKMISQLKSRKILDGARGQKKMDVSSLINCLGRLSQLMIDFPQIKELDINPISVLPDGHGAEVLDVRIVID